MVSYLNHSFPVTIVGSESLLVFWSLQVRFQGPPHSFTSCHAIAGERMSTEYWLTALIKPVQEKCG